MERSGIPRRTIRRAPPTADEQEIIRAHEEQLARERASQKRRLAPTLGASAAAFQAKIDELHSTEQARQTSSQQSETNERISSSELREQVGQLATIAREVARAANDDKLKKVDLYRRELKSLFSRKVINNRGEHKLVEDRKGWILSESNSDVITGAPGKVNLVNKSGMGLVLTEDGELFTYVEQKAPKIARKNRSDIQRVTILPRDRLSEQTFLPRAASEKRPTLLMAIDDPRNEYITQAVVDQSFDALARFVQQNNLQPPPEATQPASPAQS
jgi:hypothetical protein